MTECKERFTESSGDKVRVLFICLGNICRSPLAEAIFHHIVRDNSLDEQIEADSAGIKSWNRGKPPDPRVVEIASKRGIVVEGKARRLSTQDLRQSDYLVVMDSSNLSGVQHFLAELSLEKTVLLLGSFSSDANADIPDPFYGAQLDFERTFDIIYRSCINLLQHIRVEKGI